VPKVVITMPAYRAEGTLARTVADIPPDFADQLILVDDASPDNTARLARDLGIDVYVHPRNLGYGGNQKTCYTEALRNGADIVVLLHPDYQYEPKAVPLLIAPILAGDADMTFGSRFAGLGDPIGGGMPVYRYVGNRVTTVIENLMLGSRFSELHSGLRAYTRRCLLSLPFLRYSNDFAFDSEFLIDAVTSGHRVIEVPIPTRYTKESSSISVSRSLAYIVKTLAYCAARTSVRGRRGRRSPVTSTGRAPAIGGLVLPRRVGTNLAKQPAFDADVARVVASRLLAAVGGYVVRGGRLLVVTARPDDLRGLGADRHWATVFAEADTVAGVGISAPAHRMLGDGHEQYTPVDAVALVDGLELAADPVEALRRLRSTVDPEGILAIAAPSVGARRGLRASAPPREPGSLFNPQSLGRALGLAGFRMVEWFAPRTLAPQGARLGIAVARPTRSAIPGRGQRLDATGTDVPADAGLPKEA
jgi:hypothetical protein